MFIHSIANYVVQNIFLTRHFYWATIHQKIIWVGRLTNHSISLLFTLFCVICFLSLIMINQQFFTLLQNVQYAIIFWPATFIDFLPYFEQFINIILLPLRISISHFSSHSVVHFRFKIKQHFLTEKCFFACSWREGLMNKRHCKKMYNVLHFVFSMWNCIFKLVVMVQSFVGPLGNIKFVNPSSIKSKNR